jgi:phage FluMu protein Com
MRKINCRRCQQAWEQDVAETALRILCPKCGEVLDLTRSAQTIPGLTEQEKALIGLAGGVAIALLVINLLGGNKRRK